MKFNEAQGKAIIHNKGPALVLAGPGSGKTTVITYRIKTLVERYKVNPSNILVITFTKAAAAEMKERFLKLSGESSAVAFGTFHAVFFTILKHTCNYNANCIIHSENQSQIIRELLAGYELEIDDENEYIGLVLSEISRVKNSRLSIDEYKSIVCPDNTFRKIYKEYNQILKRKRLIDFDDMIADCYNLLKTRPEVCMAWQEKYQYILIDEFQDINQIQFDVIKLLAQKYRNIFAVGDDDQSIYGFRGSNPGIMRAFEGIYKDAVIIELSKNYRSGKNIVNNAKSVIEHNADRYKKEICPMISDEGLVEVYELNDFESEIKFIMDKMKRLHEKGIDYSNMAVLYRINSIGNLLAGKMMREQIPAEWKHTKKHIYEHWIAKDIIAYLQAADGNMNRDNILRIINKPMRYITRSFLSNPVSFYDLKNIYKTNQEVVKRIDDLQFDLKMIKKMNTFAAINYIRKGVDYDEFVKTFAKEHKIKVDLLMEILEQITDEAKKYVNHSLWLEYVSDSIRLFNEKQKENMDDSKGVHLQTMHGAKGLEYEAVFIVDFNENIIPYNKAILQEEVEEERRMLYVAMTRAKSYLCMVYAKERYNKKMTASRFLSELDTQSCVVHCVTQ